MDATRSAISLGDYGANSSVWCAAASLVDVIRSAVNNVMHWRPSFIDIPTVSMEVEPIIAVTFCPDVNTLVSIPTQGDEISPTAVQDIEPSTSTATVINPKDDVTATDVSTLISILTQGDETSPTAVQHIEPSPSTATVINPEDDVNTATLTIKREQLAMYDTDDSIKSLERHVLRSPVIPFHGNSPVYSISSSDEADVEAATIPGLK